MAGKERETGGKFLDNEHSTIYQGIAITCIS